jgi:hypothetical protein
MLYKWCWKHGSVVSESLIIETKFKRRIFKSVLRLYSLYFAGKQLHQRAGILDVVVNMEGGMGEGVGLPRERGHKGEITANMDVNVASYTY